MASYSSGSHSLDMTAIGLSNFGGGTVTASSATEIDVTGAGGFVYKLIGSGFTTFDSNGFPTDGTVTGFDIGHGGGTAAAFAGLSMDAATFMGFVSGDDLSGFETSALSGNDHIKGYIGNDVLVGEAGNDIFNLAGGGNDAVSGGDGKDVFDFAGTFNGLDTVQGGDGNDRIVLDGDYSAGVTLGATTISGVETIVLTQGHSYDLVMNDANVAAGEAMGIKAQTLGASDTVTFDASAETDGSYHVSAGAGDDRLIGGSGNDVLSSGGGDDILDISHGGHDLAVGGDGNDTILAGGAFTRFDRVNGGAGGDTLNFNGDYSTLVKIAPTQLTSVETLSFATGHDYNIAFTPNNGTDIGLVDGSALGAGDACTSRWMRGTTATSRP
jgi:Ca2+-binding RTX toxin-like protein